MANKEEETQKEVEQPKAVIAAVTTEVVEEAPKVNGHKEVRIENLELASSLLLFP